MSAWAILWFCLIAVLIIGYFVLDGFDLGVGILYPFLGKSETDKAIMRASIGPVWDGNEVWLLTAGGALFAAFAPAYATSFSGFYLAIILVLFGLILRAVSLEFRAHDPAWARGWDIGFFIGSVAPSLLFGVAIGNIICGLPLNAHGDYMGSFFGLLGIFPLVCGVLSLCVIINQGAGWIAAKTEEGGLHNRARRVRSIMQWVVAAVFVLATVLLFAVVKPSLESGVPQVLAYVFAALFVVAVIASKALARRSDLASFIAGCVMCVALVGLFAASVFPNIIPATDPANAITVANAASSDFALMCMTVITCIGLPLVLLYHVIIYRTFRGKIREEDVEGY